MRSPGPNIGTVFFFFLNTSETIVYTAAANLPQLTMTSEGDTRGELMIQLKGQL